MRLTRSVRWFALVLAYNQEDYIAFAIRNIAPQVDGIVVMYSEQPFTAYNPAARDEFRTPDRTRVILRALETSVRHMVISEGTWHDEESMRDAGLSIIRQLGGDVCLVIDADEFYEPLALERIKQFILRRWVRGNVFWSSYKNCYKRADYVVDAPYLRLPVAVIIDDSTCFVRHRTPQGMRVDLPDTLGYWHMGYVLPDRRMWEKINTFGHAHQIVPGWFVEKWLHWTPATTNLCRRNPPRWPRTVNIDVAELPTVLHQHPFVSPLLHL